MASVFVNFGTTATGMVVGDLTFDYCRDKANNSLTTADATLTEIVQGEYILGLPSVADTLPFVVKAHKTADSSVWARAIYDGHDGIPTATENADELLKRDWTSVSGEAARSVLNAMRFLRNKWSISGTTLTVTKENDTDSAWTATVTTDAAAEPITGNDPA